MPSNTTKPVFSMFLDTEDGPDAAWSPDGERIVIVGEGVMQLWDFASRWRIKQHIGRVWSAHWNRAGDRILSIESDAVEIRNGLTGRQIHRFPQSYDQVMPEAFWSQDESRILTCFNAEANVWDAQSGTNLCSIRSSARRIHNATFCFGDSHIITADADSQVCVWRITDGAEVGKMSFPDLSPIWGVKALLSPDESRGLAYATFKSAALTVFSAHDCTALYSIPAQPPMEMKSSSWANMPSWSPDGSKILTYGEMPHRKGNRSHPGILEVWNAADGSKLHEFPCADSIWGARWSHDSQRLLAYGQEGMVCIWDAVSGTLIGEYVHESSVEHCSSWLQDEALLITQTANGYVRIWDENTAEVLFEVKYDGTTNSTMLHPSRKYLLVSSILNSIDVWGVELRR